MRKLMLLLLIAIVVISISCNSKRSDKPRVLVFSKTMGFRHSSIPNGKVAIMKMGAENGFDVDTTENADVFNEDSLKKYATVIFLSTTGDVLDYKQEAAFERYIQAGGGFVGVHAATDTEYDWGWYGRLVGGYFNGHPHQQEARFIIKDKSFGATSFFTDSVWKRKDELYNFKKLSPDIHVVLTIDETSYEGGTNGAFHPMSWYQEFDGGRAFYTELGHTEESYTEVNYLKHLLGGIQYAIGENRVGDYTKVKTQLPPDEDRFTKTQLSQGEFYEPTEMTILPNLDILVIQRRGEIMLYKNDSKKVKQAGFLNVYFKTKESGVNAEEGLLGLAKDPHFDKNNWVYMYYSPADSAVNRLSRFTFTNDTIDISTEKVILEVKSQREICCHTGGSIAFGPDGLLYFSAGDNSTPFDEPGVRYVNSGFGPANDLPGRQQYDARRSSSNTNDLRGKINRIRVKDDGTYEIPDGNLFPKGTPKTRPEIYVMGNRNPYRISIDQKNGFLYWGEVGPDAGNDSLETRGPRGYDEVNQARKAGYFGWPLFVGNNYAYRQFDYATGKSGEPYDPAKPINNSRNNTGLTELPPAQPAFIWYPYAASPDFPQVGTGGRNAMAGPVYYTDMFPKETRLPDYYNNKLIIYDWIRGWVKAVTMLPNGDFDKMEPFFPSLKVNSLIDMEVGPDGKLYLLEYGTGWFTKNPDAGLARIDYNPGNIAPKVSAVTVNKTSGVLPFTIKAAVKATDTEKDALKYTWHLGTGITKETTTPELEYTFTAAGDFNISVEVNDGNGGVTKSEGVAVYAGNQEPEVSINITGGNKSFYLPGVPFNYEIVVKDNDNAAVDAANLYASVDYTEGYDKASSTMGHQQGTAAVSAKSLMASLDCKSCHKEAETSVGPSFLRVSEKYNKDPNAMSYLTQKIIKGGGGVWGEVAMAAHPNIPQADLQTIVTWILSLSNKEALKPSLPQTGTITPLANQKPNATLVLSASYTDKGGSGIKPLTGNASIALSSNNLSFTGKEKTEGFTFFNYNGNNYLMYPANSGGWFAVDSIDLTGVHSINVVSGWQGAPEFAFSYEIKIDAADGKTIGKGLMPVPAKNSQMGMVHVPIEAVTDGKFHAIYVLYTPVNPKGTLQAGAAMLQFNTK
ncbi:ThuA domain-containing protein [Limnovirga soli]|nr:ThuA domain-containing protein [Limnovirga soli]